MRNMSFDFCVMCNIRHAVLLESNIHPRGVGEEYPTHARNITLDLKQEKDVPRSSFLI